MVDPIIAELARRRRGRGQSQAVFADFAAAGRSTISEAERGATSPRLDTLRRWADALGFDIVLVRRAVGDAQEVGPL